MTTLFTRIAITEDVRNPAEPYSFGLLGAHRYWAPETFSTADAAMTLAGKRMAEMNAEYVRRRAQLAPSTKASQQTGRQEIAA